MNEPNVLDARATRVDDGVIAVLLMAAFAFDIAWLVVAAAAVATVSAALGRAASPFVRAFEEYLEPHLAHATRFVDIREWRIAQALVAVPIWLSVVLVFGWAAPIGWLIVLAVALVSALDAVAGISISRWAYRRWLQRT